MVNNELEIKNFREFWYPISQSSSLRNGDVVGLHILGDPICLVRDKSGKVACFSDRCAHRSAPLSIGRFVDEEFECKYHGWKYDTTSGNVVNIPALLPDRKIPINAKVYVYPVAEKYGLVWIWPGKGTADVNKIINFGPNSEDNEVWSDVFAASFDLDVPKLFNLVGPQSDD
jgi:phenylpropionate dioxygenase-like ring-hydroxylating dioxygenase large terminal subunit